MKMLQPWIWIKLAWAQASLGTVMSLYASEVMGLIPCTLCWYQRIALYPMVILFGVAIWRKDKFIFWYTLPLSLIGAGFALYHSMLQWGWVQEGLLTCASGVPCSQSTFNFLGFIHFPFLSLLGFGFILFCLWAFYRSTQTPRSI